MRFAAKALHRFDSTVGAFFRRKKAHLGAPKSITATAPNPESTEAMGRGVDTRDDGQGKANGASPIPVDGDEGGVR